MLHRISGCTLFFVCVSFGAVTSVELVERTDYLGGPYERIVATRVIRRADVVIAQCEQEKRQLSSFVPGANIVSIPCGIDDKRFSRRRPHYTRDIFGFNRSDKMILYVGETGGRKSVSKLISAMPRIVSKIPNAKLLIAGGGPGHDALERLASSYGLSKHVVVAGQLSEELILSAYADSDVFALASEHESFGIVLVEAAAAGLPIVSTRVGVAPEVVFEGKNGYTCDSCDDGFADRLIEVLSDDSFKTNASAMREEVKRKYGWGALADSLDSLYKGLDGHSA